MTQPVGSSSSLNYTPYNPDLELSQGEGACGGAGGAGTGGSGGAEGAGGMPSARPVPQEDLQCMSEMMKAVSTCGAAYLAGRVSLLGGLNCAASMLDLIECVTAPDPKPQGG